MSKTISKTVHLFILSGQSNMNAINPEVAFLPALQQAFPEDELIVVKDAADGRSIRLWYRNWKPAAENQVIEYPAEATGMVYDRLMKEVRRRLGDKKPTTVTFVWLQGEYDGKAAAAGTPYEESLRGVLDQIQWDLGREDVNVVIGRINTYGLSRSSERPYWGKVRLAQVSFAESYPRGAWVDLDDLGTGIHYPAEAYLQIATRFAEKAVALIRRTRAAGGSNTSNGPGVRRRQTPRSRVSTRAGTASS